MVVVVRVGVALRRPPKVDRVWQYVIQAESETEAKLRACQWAAEHKSIVMPVSAEVIDILEI